MNDVIDIILKNGIKPEYVVLWLHNKREGRSPSLLDDHEYAKQDFIPNFLNFIREQTNSFIQTNSHTGLTPNKSVMMHVTKYISPSKLSKKPLGKSSKAKTLDFSKAPISNYQEIDNISPNKFIGKDLDSFLESDENPNLPLRTPIKNHILSSPLSLEDSSYHCSIKYNTSTPKHFSFSPNGPHTDFKKLNKRNSLEHSSNMDVAKASERKHILGDYFVPDRKPLKKKNTPSRINLSVEKSPKLLSSQECDKSCFNIEDSSDFPPVGFIDVSNEKNKTKRINPTLLSSRKCIGINDSFGIPTSSQNQINAFLVAEEVVPKSLEFERKLLKEQLEKVKKDGVINKELKHQNLEHKNILCSNTSNTSCNYSESSLSSELVTHKAELDTMAQIYSSLIAYNMVPNIVLELFLLLQLLVTKKKDFPDNNKEENINTTAYFCSINNCVYFAVKSLSLLIDLLKMFDRSFIKVLSENPRIVLYDSSFNESLIQLYNNARVNDYARKLPQSPILSVSFQIETDNKNNFPSTVAFQIFRKQRDLFYEMLRIWEDNHLTPGWSFNQNLNSKIYQLFSLRSDAVNYAHFARLFISQLITMCKGNEKSCTYAETEDLMFLNQLKRQHPEKYKRLYDRLITPSKVGGPVPLPSFPGSQEFFKDFIIVAGNHSFNIHLRDALIVKILQLNSMNFEIGEVEEGDQYVVREEAWATLQSLRLLAKFLGYIEFLPYKTCDPLSDNVIANQVHIRNHLNPAISLSNLLREGATSGCLVMVVPWMVELLSMVDAVAFHTKYYLTLIFELIFIYRLLYLCRSYPGIDSCHLCGIISSTKFTLAPLNCLFLKLVLGWLFSLPNVPENLFYALVEEAEIDHCEFQETTKIINYSYAFPCSVCSHSNMEAKLDKISLFEKNDHSTKIGNYNANIKDIKLCYSPNKKQMSMTPMKKKNNLLADKTSDGVNCSPLKTPSKFLEVSMLDTPENTPDKVVSKDVENLGRQIFDSWTFIDHQILLTCCPYVNELKSIVNEFSVGATRFNNGSTVRKITPLSAFDKNGEQHFKELQLQLEDNFFHNQPSSTKKTVDFIVERIYSNVLRNVRSTIIPMLKDDCLNRLKTCVNSSMMSSATMDKLTESTEKNINALSRDLSIEIRGKALTTMNELLELKYVESSLQYLLPIEASDKSVKICVQIISRLVSEKVASWLNCQLSPGFCTKELTSEAKKFIKLGKKAQQNDTSSSFDTSANSFVHNKSLEDPSIDFSTTGAICSIFKDPTKESQQMMNGIIKCHNLDALSPSMMLQKIKGNLRKLTTDADDVITDVDVLTFLKSIHQTITERKDMTLAVFKAAENLCIDWMAAICVSKPSLVTMESMKFFMKLWSPNEKERIFCEEPNFSVFLVHRTIMLLGQQKEVVQISAWKKLEEIIVEIVIVNNFLTPISFQENCIELLRHEWPEIILRGLSSFIKNVVNKMEKSSKFKNDPDASLLGDWVGWVCSEMAEF